ncbi:acyl-CoA oxidase [Aspergillus campestris IBT 28561]|uniref:Acyl-coenzyme A oxidase n=1 Tax=Aspergillus campestris (strain IBT 28561) TaxID=1392248 RepID=A0A2I1D3H5_ASPC2|nr:acyl-CoA oxidase [Aspergillus campestris IBT 28561]PKY04427.1 acyl-CoA oxidase [Aspergillus campestris IBT 28561]
MPDFTDKLRPKQPDGPEILTLERVGSDIAIGELAHHLLGQDGFLERQTRILPIVQKEPLFDKTRQQNLSRPERFKLALARAKQLRRLSDQHVWTLQEYKLAEYLVDDVSPYMLQMEMFATTIEEQGTDAQRAHWMPRVESWQVVGAYAQTELGHGSNVRGLELEARWDGENKGFVLHSPTLTASKWWNGTLGRTANHAIVVAQLLLPHPNSPDQFVSHGPQPFIIQVRDMTTHQPLDGIIIGDIGPKYGYATMDNAYMLFDNFRIPHSALLSRYANVDPDTGHFSRHAMPAVVYGSLTAVRSRIVQHARLVLARAVTVAVRYTAIRRQFRDRDAPDTAPELSVLDYPTVQIRILPLLATTYALHYVGQAMQTTYERTRSEIESGSFASLANMHSMSSGLKSLCTMLVADGIEVCRRAMGGHGYGGGSGLIQLNNDYLSKPTVEGDNWMITQQTASYLIKKMSAAVAAVDDPPADALDGQYKLFLQGRARGGPYRIFHEDYDLVRSFQRRATVLTHNAYIERVVKQRSWSSLMIQLHKLSRAQSQSILVSTFFDALDSEDNLNLSEPLRRVLWDLFRLFALTTMETDSYDFLASKAASGAQLDTLPGRIQELMGRIRPHAVSLVDAWMIPDFLLDSALGRYDGRVYEDLFNRAHRQNPLNRMTVNPNYWEDEIVKGGDDMKSIRTKL